MKTGHKIIILSIILGLSVWVIDAILDYIFFYQGAFLDLLVMGVPSHEFYIRSVILGTFVIFGMIASSIVTKRENIQASLRESEERFRQIAENISKILWSSDPTRSSFLYLSPSCQEILGVAPATLYEAPQRFTELIHPEDRPRVLAAVPGMARGEYNEEFRVVRPTANSVPGTGLSGSDRHGGVSHCRYYRGHHRAQTGLRTERYLDAMNLLFHTSLQVLAEKSHQGMLQQVVDAARDLTGARLGVSVHGRIDGRYMVSASSRDQLAAPCPPSQSYMVDKVGLLGTSWSTMTSIRLTTGLRGHAAWHGLWKATPRFVACLERG
jgi:PAS domain S-box-containing protein